MCTCMCIMSSLSLCRVVCSGRGLVRVWAGLKTRDEIERCDGAIFMGRIVQIAEASVST